MSDTDDPQSRPSHDKPENAAPNGDVPTLVTPLGAASLWKEFLRDPVRHRRALDGLAVKPERWGDYKEAAATMWRLSFTELPVSTTSRSPNVAYVRFVEGAVDWFLTTVRGADGLWRVWDLTEQRRPPASEIFD